ncbi:hypothetical protein L218DRAFT_1008274 [Marasmius fiardii PR-910]|nr:hypothetical protein L218DRAFT_1008274 [Marasmius fiardii PR-910]
MTGLILFTDDPELHGRSVKIAAYYMFDNSFYGVIWYARASIFLTLELWFLHGAFYSHKYSGCVKGNLVGRIRELRSLIVFFDANLIADPVYLLKDMKSHHGLKIRLIAVFSSTVATTAFSLAHAYCIIEDRGLMEFMLACFEVFISLIVVNLTVIVSWLFKINDDSDPGRISRQLNTFHKGRLSGRSKNTMNQTKTMGL